MSQGIMEKNLPVAESIQSGDKIRIVTSAGNSKQVDASQIGGGGALKVTITSEVVGSDVVFSTDKTYNQIANAESVMFVNKATGSENYDVGVFSAYGFQDGAYGLVVAFPAPINTLVFVAESADEILTATGDK